MMISILDYFSYGNYDILCTSEGRHWIAYCEEMFRPADGCNVCTLIYVCRAVSGYLRSTYYLQLSAEPKSRVTQLSSKGYLKTNTCSHYLLIKE